MCKDAIWPQGALSTQLQDEFLTPPKSRECGHGPSEAGGTSVGLEATRNERRWWAFIRYGPLLKGLEPGGVPVLVISCQVYHQVTADKLFSLSVSLPAEKLFYLNPDTFRMKMVWDFFIQSTCG